MPFVLELLKIAEVSPDELRVRVQAEDHDDGDTLMLKASVCKDFQFVWNQTPAFLAGGFVHEARPDAYLIYPGARLDDEIVGPAYASVRGLDALFFASAVYSRVMEKRNVPS